MRCCLGALLAAVVLSGCSARPSAPRDDPDPAKRVEQLGGTIARDDTQPGKPVIEVNLALKKVTDADLKELKELKQLTTLNLGSTKVTDAGVKELQEALPKCKIIR